MASATLHVTVRIADSERTKLFVWELEMLVNEMRVMASPHAEKLERLLARYTEGGDDDRPDDS